MGLTRLDRVINEDIQKWLGVAPIEKKMWEACLQWYGHAQRGEFGVKNSPPTRPLRPTARKTKEAVGWTQSPKTCARWISPQKTPKTDPYGEDRATQRTLCWEDARKEREHE